MATHRSLTIALATIIPGVALIALLIFICVRNQRRRKSRIFKRGITPIDDEEIESWRTDNSEKHPDDEAQGEPQTRSHHKQSTSVASVTKPPSVIVYHNQGLPRVSGEQAQRGHQQMASIDSIQSPVLARAPNARPGLTDDTVQGDEAFIPHLKRQPSRLSKNQAAATTKPGRSKSARNSIAHDQWYGHGLDNHTLPPRRSAESFPRSPAKHDTHKRVYSSPSNPPRMSLDDDQLSMGGLSPRPLIRKSEIGRAIG